MGHRILLLGKNGQVGWELQRALAPMGQICALDATDEGGDLTDLVTMKKQILNYKPTVIVNAAAYTAVDKAEQEQALAKQINTTAVGFLAEMTKQLNAWLIHYSTDYVFNGEGQHFRQEHEPPTPLNTYGKTKLAGENAIKAVGGHYLIFRTSWVYATRGNNFIKTILRLAQQRQTLSIINDQIGAPTGAELIADVTAHAIGALSAAHQGIYHLTASGACSWYDFANLIISEARQSISEQIQVNHVAAIATTDYPTPALRPLNSRLNTQKLQTTFNLNLPEWSLGVKRVLTELLNP